MASIGEVKRIVIHHSGGGSTVAEASKGRDYTTAAGIRKWHVNNEGWSDIGYHKVIRGNGLLENGRSESTLGEHVFKGNTGSLGVCCTGHFGLVKPTTAQLNTLVKLLASWCSKHKLSVNDIYGHHNVPVGRKKAACPGKNMVAKFKWIKQQVAAKIMPAKYVLSAKVKDLTVRRLLERAIDDDGRLSLWEIHDIIAAVVGDGTVSQQEILDLRTIADHSKSLSGVGKLYLHYFLWNPNAFIDHNRKVATQSVNGTSKLNLSPTQRANRDFYKRYPNRKGTLLTNSAADKRYRDEWMKSYLSHGGK